MPDGTTQRVFLTGATGYLGGTLARRLLAEGRHVVALVRAESAPERVAALEALGAVTSQGDVTDRYSLRPGMSGADWVIHAAAEVDLKSSPERMRRVNVQGSENVASLAYKLGVGRLLSVSSVAYFGGSPADGSPGTEESEPHAFPTLYSATKHGGERAIREWAERGLAVNTVYPSLIYGPPGKEGGTNALLRMVVEGRMPFLVGAHRRLSWVHVDDVVDGIVRVMEGAPEGRDYLLAGEVATLSSVVERACALAGGHPPRLTLPLPVARLAVAARGVAARLRGRRPPFTQEQLNSLEHHWAFDDSRARNELGWRPRGLEEGLPPTVAMLLGKTEGDGREAS